MILEKTGRTSHTLILARASAIPVLSGLPLDAIARYAGQPAVLDAQCGVLAINPNDAVSGYYQVAQTLADKRQNNRRKLPRSWPIPVIKSVLILRRILAQLWKPQARLPTARKALGCFVPKCSIWIATARRTSRNSLKRTSRCYWRRATSRLSSARWTSVAIKHSLPQHSPGREPVPRLSRGTYLPGICWPVPHSIAGDFARCQFRQRPVDDPNGPQSRSDLMGEG